MIPITTSVLFYIIAIICIFAGVVGLADKTSNDLSEKIIGPSVLIISGIMMALIASTGV